MPGEFAPLGTSGGVSAPTEPVSLSALAADAVPASAPTPAFDLGSINLDLNEPVVEAAPAMDSIFPELDSASSDAMARKLDLAEEFRQIGDADGARELLQEVVASTPDTSLQAKARAMLDKLG